MSANKDSTFAPSWFCAAPVDRPCRRQVPVEGAVCPFCMYDGHIGAAYPEKGAARESAQKSLERCFENAGKMFAKMRAKKILAKQGKQEEDEEA